MQITEVLISYYTKAIAEHKTASKQLAMKSKLSKIKKTEKTIESKTTMQHTAAVVSVITNPVIIDTPIIESEEILEEPIFGLETTDRSWIHSLKKVNPAAYQNLMNGD